MHVVGSTRRIFGVQWRGLRVVVLAYYGAFALACAHAGRSTAAGAVDGSLQGMTGDANREELAESAQLLGASLSRGVVQGVRTELSDGLVSDDEFAEAGQRIEAVMRENLAAGTAAMLRSGIDATLASASTDTNIRRAQQAIEAQTYAAALGLTTGAAEGLRRDLGPAVDEVTQSMRSTVTALVADQTFRAAMGGMAHEITREIVLGSEAALDDIEAHRDPHGDGSFFNRIVSSFFGRPLLLAIVLLPWLILIAFGVVLWRLRRRLDVVGAQLTQPPADASPVSLSTEPRRD